MQEAKLCAASPNGQYGCPKTLGKPANWVITRPQAEVRFLRTRLPATSFEKQHLVGAGCSEHRGCGIGGLEYATNGMDTYHLIKELQSPLDQIASSASSQTETLPVILLSLMCGLLPAST